MKNEQNTEALESELKPVIAKAEEFQVRTREEYELAAEYLKTEIKAKQKVVTEFFKETKGNAHKTWKSICEQEAEILSPLTVAEQSIKCKLLDYEKNQERKAREEQARINAEEEERAKRERERALKAAEKLKTPELREQRMTEAEAIEPRTVHVPAEVPDVKGLSRRKEWVVSVTDEAAFLKAAAGTPMLMQFVEIKTGAIKKLCQSTGQAQVMPGIHCEQVASLASRG